MFPIKCNIDGKPFRLDALAKDADVRYAAAMCLAGFADDSLRRDSILNVELTDYPKGSGQLKAEDVLRWALTTEGREALAEHQDDGFLTRLEQLAKQLALRE